MADEYPTQLRFLLRKLTDDFKEIWEKEFEPKIENYKYRLEEKGAFDIVYFIYSIPEIEQLESYNELKKLVSTRIRANLEDYFLFSNSDVILDYLVVSVTNNEISYENLFSTEGFETAYQLLLEDTTFELKTNRGTALLSGIELNCHMVEISDTIRIRRVSRFEIEHFKKSLPSYAVEPFDYHKVNSLYFLEFQSDIPFNIDDEQIELMQGIENRLKGRIGLTPTVFNPEDYKMGLSRDIADDIIQNFLSCFRLLWGYNVKLHWIQYRSVHGEEPNKIMRGWDIGNVKHEFMTYKSTEIKNRVHFKTEEVAKLIEFWNLFKQFSENIDQSTLKYFERALTRFNRSFVENDQEDAIIDLAICLEIITSGAKGQTSFLLAPFIAYNEHVEEVQKEIAEFDRVRNNIVHGSVSTLEKTDLYKWTSIGIKIASACLRNFMFYVINSPPKDKPKGKRGFRDTLDACKVNIQKQSWFHKVVPEWSMIESTK